MSQTVLSTLQILYHLIFKTKLSYIIPVSLLRTQKQGSKIMCLKVTHLTSDSL